MYSLAQFKNQKKKVQGLQKFTKYHSPVFPVNTQHSSMFQYNNLLSSEKMSVGE